jgi:hypothetical protein
LPLAVGPATMTAAGCWAFEGTGMTFFQIAGFELETGDQ